MKKKLISRKRGVCPVCGKKGRIDMYSNGEGFCEHKRTKTEIVIFGQHSYYVEGCPIPKKI